jgi:hypothetical protein
MEASLYYHLCAHQLHIKLLEDLFPDKEDPSPRLTRRSDCAWALHSLANAYALFGQPRRAAELLERHNLLRKKARRDKRHLAIGLGNLARQHVALGELAAAELELFEGLKLCHATREHTIEALLRQELGILRSYQEAFDEADKELQESIRLHIRLGDAHGTGAALASWALYALCKGDSDRALEAAQTSSALARGHIEVIEAQWLLGAALLAQAASDARTLEMTSKQHQRLMEAEAHLTEALTHCHQYNFVQWEARVLLEQARLRRLCGENQSARAIAQEARDIAERYEYHLLQADIDKFLG